MLLLDTFINIDKNDYEKMSKLTTFRESPKELRINEIINFLLNNYLNEDNNKINELLEVLFISDLIKDLQELINFSNLIYKTKEIIEIKRKLKNEN